MIITAIWRTLHIAKREIEIRKKGLQTKNKKRRKNIILCKCFVLLDPLGKSFEGA
uniref:Uncharacterized protein n=1 Tax=Rhizophora mucronata TaxID=61149 RepID=A0A2P2Q893_RHIMU